MAENPQSIQTVDTERYLALAHASQTTAEPRHSLALEGTVTEPSPDNATGYPPSGTGRRGFFNTATRARSTSSVSSLRSSTSIKPAHWTNSFVDYAPVPPPRQKQLVDPGPPSLPPLALGSSILNDLLHEESPALRPLPDIPESHDLEFPRVTDGQEGTNRERRPPESIYSSPSNMNGSTDDVQSSRSTASDSDGPRTDDLSLQSIMDLPCRHSSAYSFGMGDTSMADNEQFPDNPHVTLADSTVGDPPQRHKKLVTTIRNRIRNRIHREKVAPVANALFQPPVVPGPPRVSGTGIQYNDFVSYPSDDRSFSSTSEYIGRFCWCQMGNAS